MPPVQKEAVMAEDIIPVVETLDRSSLRSLRRSEIFGLDLKADQTADGRGISRCDLPGCRDQDLDQLSIGSEPCPLRLEGADKNLEPFIR